jgi:hypothetical protein
MVWKQAESTLQDLVGLEQAASAVVPWRELSERLSSGIEETMTELACLSAFDSQAPFIADPKVLCIDRPNRSWFQVGCPASMGPP